MATQTTRRDAISRGVAFCSVVVMHALFVLAIQRIRQPPTAAPDDRYLVWLRTEPSQIPSQPVQPTPALRVESRPQPAAASGASVAPAADSPPTDTAPQRIDWSTAAALEARRVAEAEGSPAYRSFGPRKPQAPAPPPPPSVFKPPPRHRYGETGLDAMDEPVVWLSEHCYQELSRTIRTARDYGFERPLLAKCVFSIGKLPPRGDLFEPLKKDQPLLAARPGAMAELPEQTDAGSNDDSPPLRNPP